MVRLPRLTALTRRSPSGTPWRYSWIVCYEDGAGQNEIAASPLGGFGDGLTGEQIFTEIDRSVVRE